MKFISFFQSYFYRLPDIEWLYYKHTLTQSLVFVVSFGNEWEWPCFFLFKQKTRSGKSCSYYLCFSPPPVPNQYSFSHFTLQFYPLVSVLGGGTNIKWYLPVLGDWEYDARKEQEQYNNLNKQWWHCREWQTIGLPVFLYLPMYLLVKLFLFPLIFFPLIFVY